MERRLWASARHLQTVGLSVLVILAVVGMVGLAIDIDPVEDPGTIRVVLTYEGTPLNELGLTYYDSYAGYVRVVGEDYNSGTSYYARYADRQFTNLLPGTYIVRLGNIFSSGTSEYDIATVEVVSNQTTQVEYDISGYVRLVTGKVTVDGEAPSSQYTATVSSYCCGQRPNQSLGSNEGSFKWMMRASASTATLQIKWVSTIVGSETFTVTAGETFDFGTTEVDSTSPTINDCPSSQGLDAVAGTCAATATWTPPTASDNMDPSPTLTTTHAPGSSFPAGTTTVTYTATDESGNSSQCAFTITVNDPYAPSISCPGPVTVNTDLGQCYATGVSLGTPTVSDNCGIPTVMNNAPVQFSKGPTTVTWTATDASGNTATCTQTVTVVDNEPPAITCPGNIIVSTDPGFCDAYVEYTIPVGTDNCPGEAIILTAGLGSGEFFPVGITTETYSVTDMAGNSASRSFTVTVVDTILPVITLNGEAAVTLECGVDTYTEVGAVATDACCPGALIIAGDAVDVSATGTYVVTYNAQDCNGNSAVEVDRTVHVVDTLNPTIVGCPANIEINNDLGQCGALVTWDEPSTSDECCLAAFTSNHHPGDFFPVGTTTVLYAANDCNGLASTCSFEITVVDTEPPTTVFVTTPSDPDNNPQPFFEWTGSDNNACTPSLQLMYSTQLDGTGWNGWFADTSATIGPLSEGWHIYEVRAMDQAGNIESTATYTWFVDLTAPTVLIHMPENNQEYSLSSVVAASWKTSDGESGLAIVTYTAENGDPIDTSTPGTHSFFVEAWDIAENSTRVDIEYRAVYSVIPEGSAGGGGATGGERGFLDHQIAGGGGLVGRVPLAAVYTLGEYINVGFTLSDDSGQLMSDAVVSLTIMYLVLAEGGEEYDILSIDVIPYDPELGMYALSVATVSGELAFEPGYYDLWIGFDDGTQELMRIQVVSPEE